MSEGDEQTYEDLVEALPGTAGASEFVLFMRPVETGEGIFAVITGKTARCPEKTHEFLTAKTWPTLDDCRAWFQRFTGTTPEVVFIRH
jgi:hypothetical protein